MTTLLNSLINGKPESAPNKLYASSITSKQFFVLHLLAISLNSFKLNELSIG